MWWSCQHRPDYNILKHFISIIPVSCVHSSLTFYSCYVCYDYWGTQTESFVFIWLLLNADLKISYYTMIVLMVLNILNSPPGFQIHPIIRSTNPHIVVLLHCPQTKQLTSAACTMFSLEAFLSLCRMRYVDGIKVGAPPPVEY